jgi:cytochrome b561
MSLRNTATNYGTIAKTLHWLTAFLFLMSYSTVYFREWFTVKDTPENWLSLQLHLSVGITIAVIVLLRVIWKLSDKSPQAEPGSKLEHQVVKLGHLALYAIMFIAPITGYLGTGVHTEYFTLFNIPGVIDTVFSGDKAAFKAFEQPIDFIHKELLGEFLILVLVGGHIAAALYHHFVKKDRTLKRMTSGKD